MKLPHLIPPVVVLVLAGSWNLELMRSLSSLENERLDLRKRISEVPESSRDRIIRSRRSPKSELSDTEKIDWKFIAFAAFKDGSAGESRELIRFQRRLANMTPQEMADALDEIAGSGMSAKGRHRLESMIIEKLIALDPAMAFSRFADRIGDRHGIGVFLTDAFAKWAKTDVAAATGWFDKAIAEGKFDLKSLDDSHDMRQAFEGTLMNHLLKTDTGLASQRISGLPVDQRAGVMKSIEIWNPSTEYCSAYGDIVRSLIPSDQQIECFASVGHILRADLEDWLSEVNRFLEHSKATPDQRDAMLVAVGAERLDHFSNSPGGVLEEMQENFKDLAPDQVGSLIGKAMALWSQEHQSGEDSFEATARLLQQYQEESTTDDTLVAFLDASSEDLNPNDTKKQKLMIELAGEIRDEGQRNRILARLEPNKPQP